MLMLRGLAERKHSTDPLPLEHYLSCKRFSRKDYISLELEEGTERRASTTTGCPNTRRGVIVANGFLGLKTKNMFYA